MSLDHADNGFALMFNGEPVPRRDGSLCLPIPAMGIFGQVVIAGRKKPTLVVILAHDAKATRLIALADANIVRPDTFRIGATVIMP